MNARRKKEIRKLFGAYLRQRRESILHIGSVRQLALGSNLDASKLSKVEKGLIDVRFDTLMEIAVAYHMHPRELFQFGIDFWEDEKSF